MRDWSSSSNSLPPGIRTGDVIANRYRLEGIVGRGGMAVVVSAQHLELDERVAVKFMSPDALSDPEAVARFDREVRAAARIKSEYVARVYDAGKLGDGRRFMVLEFLEGEDLSVRIRRDGPLSPEQAIRFALQASSAVLEAHGLGIIHRDLKPANLRVIRRADGSEIVKVLDFGVMKRMPGVNDATQGDETQPGTVVGTPLYTSPEQLRGSNSIDARADVWSLGASLFELLTGSPPFGGRTYPQVIANVLESSPPPLRQLRPEISEQLEGVVLRCLAKLPDDRFGDMVEFAQALADTIDLDAELRGLLERMQRQGKSQPMNSAVGQQSATRANADRSSPHHPPQQHIGRPWGDGTPAGTKEYQPPRASRRGLFVTVGAAVVSASFVVVLGLPWLPNFNLPPSGTTPIPLDEQQRPLTQTQHEVTPDAPARDLPEQTVLPPVASTQSVAALAASGKLSQKRIIHPNSSARVSPAKSTSDPTPSPTAGSTATSSGPQRNPLLVKPW